MYVCMREREIKKEIINNVSCFHELKYFPHNIHCVPAEICCACRCTHKESFHFNTFFSAACLPICAIAIEHFNNWTLWAFFFASYSFECRCFVLFFSCFRLKIAHEVFKFELLLFVCDQTHASFYNLILTSAVTNT